MKNKIEKKKIIVIAAGYAYTSYILTEEKEIFSCGCGSYGTLGTGNTNNRNVFEKVEFKEFWFWRKIFFKTLFFFFIYDLAN